ncbi:hypothetical protein [Arthrobacter sp. Y81]|uniref:hypothetical protein n=1 Tax=Arthrobacter sp. Y81 TaxID=2058897 RepID=UPI001CA5225F
MTADATTLIGNVHVRMLQASDSGPMSAAYLLNRDHLAPWEPARTEEFFTAAGQRAVVDSKLALDGSRIVGSITLTGIVRGPFLSAHVAPAYLKIAGSWQDHVLFQRILE